MLVNILWINEKKLSILVFHLTLKILLINIIEIYKRVSENNYIIKLTFYLFIKVNLKF